MAAEIGTLREALEPSLPTPDLIGRSPAFHWPGNIRELENVLERGVTLGPDGTVRDRRFDDALRDVADLNHEAHEARLIDEALRRARGDAGEAARLLGLTRRQIDYRLEAREGGG